MGCSIKIQDTNLDIRGLKCSQCQQPFTPQDKETDNWDLWFDTSHDVEFKKDERWWRLGSARHYS